MSKIDKRRSVKFPSSQHPRANLSKATRIPKTPHIRSNLQNRTPLDIKITKVSKPTSECSNQRTQQTLFRTGPGSLFAPNAPKDNNNHHGSETQQAFPNTANSTVDKHADEGMHFDQSQSIFTSGLKTVGNPIRMHSHPNSPDSSSTFFEPEPDSTVDDEDLERNLILDSNKLSDSSVLTKNTKLNIPIYQKPSSKPKAGSETPRKNLSVKELTQYKPNSAKAKTHVVGKTVTAKARKPSNEKNNRDSFNDDLQIYDFDTVSNVYSHQHCNSTKKKTPVYKGANSTGKKTATAAAKGSNLDKLPQRRLQTPVISSPVISSLSNSKSKPKSSAAVRKVPPTPKQKSKPKFPSPELFVDDHDSNQLASSADLVLPSSDDLIEPERISVFRNRLKTPQVMNSSIYTPSSDCLENTSRYPLRSKTTSSPVTYDLPSIRRQRTNSLSVQSTPSKTRVESKSKATHGIPAAAKSHANRSLHFSQFSSAHDSLLDLNTPEDTQIDAYDFATTSAPTRRRSLTNQKRTSAQQKVQNESAPKVASAVPTAAKSFVKPPLHFSQFSSVHDSLLDFNTPEDTQIDAYDFATTSAPTRCRSQTNQKRTSAQQKVQNESTPKVASGVPSTAKSFVNTTLQFSQFSSIHDSLLEVETPQDTPKDVYEFVSTSPPTKRRPQARKKRATAQRKPRASKSTPVKKPAQPKSTINPLFSASFNELLQNVSSRSSITTPKSKPMSNPNALSELTNQVPKKGRANVSKQAKNKAGNFLSSAFSQRCQTPSQPQQTSMFTTPGSQPSQNYLNSNTSFNSFPRLFNQASTPNQTRRNSNQTYGNIFVDIDRINHNNNEDEMQELCDLLAMLKVSVTSNDAKSSFLSYRDPCRVEKSYVKRNDDTSCEKPRKKPFFRNTFANYRMSSDLIVEENETPFSRASEKNFITSGLNSHSLPFKYAGETPAMSKDATDETNLSARAALRSVKYISRKVPHYFYADGDYNLDGFSDWN